MIHLLSRLPILSSMWALLAALIGTLSFAGSVHAASEYTPPTPPEFVVNGAPTAPDISAALARQFGLAPEHAKAIAELYADNLGRIQRGELKQGDIVLRLRGLDR